MEELNIRQRIILSILGRKQEYSEYLSVIRDGHNIFSKLDSVTAMESISPYNDVMLTEYLVSVDKPPASQYIYSIDPDVMEILRATKYCNFYRESLIKAYTVSNSFPVMILNGVDGIKYAAITFVHLNPGVSSENFMYILVTFETEKKQKTYKKLFISSREDFDNLLIEPRVGSTDHRVWTVLLAFMYICAAHSADETLFAQEFNNPDPCTRVYKYTDGTELYCLGVQEQSYIPYLGNIYSLFEKGLSWLCGYSNPYIMVADADFATRVIQERNWDLSGTNIDLINYFTVVAETVMHDKRIVMLYEDESFAALRNRYTFDDVIPEVFYMIPEYIPFDVFTVASLDTRTVANVSIVQLDTLYVTIHILAHNGWKLDRIVTLSDADRSDFATFDLDKVISEVREQYIASVGDLVSIFKSDIEEYVRLTRSLVEDVLLLLYHICLAEKVKMLRRQTSKVKELSLTGAENSIDDSVDAADTFDDSAESNNLLASEQEDDSPYVSNITVFSLTPRSYKVHKESVARSSGWKMPEHFRKGHMRSVWVGSGENKHKETRWIEPTIVNKGEGSRAIIKKIKL